MAGADITGGAGTVPPDVGLIVEASGSQTGLDVQCLGFEVQLACHCAIKGLLDPIHLAPDDALDAEIDLNLLYNGVTVDSASYVNEQPNALATITIDGSGSWMCTAQVEEFFDLIALDSSVVNNIDGVDFPTFGGQAAQPQGLPAIGGTFYETFVPGSTISFTATCGGLTVSHEVPAPSGAADYRIYAAATVSGEKSSRECSTTFKLNKQVFGAPYQVSDSFGSADCSSGAKAVINGSAPYTWQAVNSATPPQNFTLDAHARTPAGPFPAALAIDLQDKARLSGSDWIPSHIQLPIAPDSSYTWSQNEYECYAQKGTNASSLTPVTGLAAHEMCPVCAWLDAATMGSDDARDWRMPIQLYPWQALQVNCQTTTADVAEATALTASSNSIAISQGNWEGYRYLQYTLSGSPAGTLHLTVGPKQYPTTTGAQVLDLCDPSSLPSGFQVDERQSRFPVSFRTNLVANPVDGLPIETGAQPGWLFGMLTHSSSVSLVGLGPSETVTLGPLKLMASATAEIGVLLSFANDVLGWTSPTDNSYLGQDLWLTIDGKQLGPLPFRKHVLPTNGSPASFTYYALSDLVIMIDWFFGWSAIALPAPSNYPTDASTGAPLASSSSLAGNLDSYVFDGSNWIDQSALSAFGHSVNLVAALKIDQVSTYPGCGDPLKAYGPNPFPVRMSKVLRAQVEGLVFDGQGHSVSGAKVSVASGGLSSTGTTGTNGFYRSGSPFAYGYKALAASLQSTTASFTAEDAQRVRISFIGAPPPGAEPSNLCGDNGWYYRVHVDEHENILFVAANTATTSWLVETQVTSDGGWSKPVLALDSRGRLELRALQSSQLFSFASDDNGVTWSAPEAL